MPPKSATTRKKRYKESYHPKPEAKFNHYGQLTASMEKSLKLPFETETTNSKLKEAFGEQLAFVVNEQLSLVTFTNAAREVLGDNAETGKSLQESKLSHSESLDSLTAEIEKVFSEDVTSTPRYLRIELDNFPEKLAYCLTLKKTKLIKGKTGVYCTAERIQSKSHSEATASPETHANKSTVSWALNIQERTFELYRDSVTKPSTTLCYDEWLQSISEKDRDKVSKAFKRLFDGEDASVSFRYQATLPNGETRTATTVTRTTPSLDEAKPSVIVGMHHYELDSRSIVDDLRLFSQLARKVQLAILVYDENGHIVWTNNSFTEATGFAHDEVIGRDPISLLSGPLTEKETVSYMRDRLRRGKAFHAEVVQYKKTGAPYWVRIDGTPLSDENGRIARFVTFQTDITEAKKTQSAILRNEIKFRSLFDNSIDALLLLSPRDGVVIEANTSAIQLLDTNRLVGQRIAEIFPDNPSFNIENLNEIVDREETERRETSEIVNAVGQILPVELTVSRTPIGESMALFVSLRDISEKRLLEEQLRHSQRMEAVGRLSGGIAHDFNNLLAGLRGFTELLCNSSSLSKKDQTYASEIMKITDRSSKLTSRLLSFSRGKSEKPVIANLNSAVSNLMPMLSRILKTDVQFTSKLDPTLCNVKVDTNQIDQVIMNLVVNGQEAISNQEGVVSLRTEVVELSGNEIFITGKPKPGRYAKVAVRDNGHGIPRDVLEKIFEPFFTTKKGAGTGLGLPIVYGIIQSNGGHLSVVSEVGDGTEFAFYFPEAHGTVQEEEKTDYRKSMPSAQSSESGDTPTILVAEDQEQVREILELGLGQSGYNLIVAKDGLEAIEMAQTFEGDIDLLLTDSIMPRASGCRVVKELRELYPEIKVILVSGLPQQESEDCRNIEVDAYVDKPFSIRNLLELINELVGVSK